MSDWNAGIIEEFRANDGMVGGMFEGKPVLLLNHTGARSGKAYTSPLMYYADGERLIVFASKAGAPTNPDWYHNLKANPDVTVEVGTETHEMSAAEVTGEERDTLFAKQAAAYPQFAEYQQGTSRSIPVIALGRT